MVVSSIQYTCIFVYIYIYVYTLVYIHNMLVYSLLTDGSKTKFYDLCLKFRSRNLVIYSHSPPPPPPLAAFTPLAEHTGTSTTCSFSLVNRHVDFFLASSFQPGEMNAFVSLLIYNLIAPLCENIKNKLSLLFSGPIHHFHLSKTKYAHFYSRIYLFYLPCNDRGWLNILKLHIFLRTEVNEVGRDINVFFQS